MKSYTFPLVNPSILIAKANICKGKEEGRVIKWAARFVSTFDFCSPRLLNSNRSCCFSFRFTRHQIAGLFLHISVHYSIHNRNIISENLISFRIVSPFLLDRRRRRSTFSFLLSVSIHSVCGKFFISFLKCIIVNVALFPSFLVVALIFIGQWWRRKNASRVEGQETRCWNEVFEKKKELSHHLSFFRN